MEPNIGGTSPTYLPVITIRKANAREPRTIQENVLRKERRNGFGVEW